MKKILDLVVVNGGLVKFKLPFLPRTWNIFKVRAVYFDEQFNDEDDPESEKWNAYVDKVHNAIGVDCYCEWVRENGEIIGIIALFNDKNEEIKVKHFKVWNTLFALLEYNKDVKYNINDLFDIVIKQGYKKIGKFKGTRSNKSKYQQFRKNDRNIWIGYAFIESEEHGHALDYWYKNYEEIKEYLNLE